MRPVSALVKMCSKLALSFALTLAAVPAAAEPAPSWIYMDLGEVLVTGNPTDGYAFVPGALEFLADLRANGHKLALITNIPEAWGVTCGAKLTMLKDFLQTRMNEPVVLESVLWPLLDAVVLPPFDRYRKPQRFVFVDALANACPGRALYLGENAAEIDVAKTIGFATFLKTDELPTLAQVTTGLDEDFGFGHPEQCDFAPLLSAILLPQDAGAEIQGCVLPPLQ